MIHCIIFDLDGTLVDSLPGIAASLNRTLDAHGLPGHSHARVRAMVGKGLPHLIRSAGPQGADPVLTESLLSLYRRDYARSWRDGSRLYPGILPMLDELVRMGRSLAVLTNKTHEFAVEMVHEMFPAVPFGSVLGIREGIAHKPDPGGALHIVRHLGIDPTECVMVGDSTMDLETAHNAGMRGIGATWGYQDRARLAAAGVSRLVDRPDEIPPLVANDDDAGAS